MRIARPHLVTLLLGACSFILAFSLLLFPEDSFKASLRGLTIWWDVVFPALLPFFIASEILLGFGLAHFMGVLLEPLMRPVFNLPGTGSFVLTMGFASGYPVSAKLTTRLREQKLISRVEGERLVSFTTTSDPVFITGAVAVGFFHSVKTGIILLVVHYLSALLIGAIMSFYRRGDEKTPSLNPSDKPILYRALQSMHRARMRDGRPIGMLMGDAVNGAIQTQLLVGGFMLFFSVVLTVLMKLNFITLISVPLGNLLHMLGYPLHSAKAFIYGFFEVTLGAKQASTLFSSDLSLFIMAVASAILAWGGISVHAQVASILAETDIRYLPFLFARCCHAVLAFILTFPIGSALYGHLQDNAMTVWLDSLELSSFSSGTVVPYTGISSVLCIGIIIIMALFLGICKVYARKSR
ncbi:sporulation integral membrane protein YlbJ [Aneurinibacillus terranovensis]|uniref:sporulation integral membrane protein YlbJ n=1 Tax=Aneurinibacillus terranovensis TaxID=278991 RepID=UPI0004224849|nr:sporulation integral membrane protein YlbJ [Aneurinibacillus terranovensis]